MPALLIRNAMARGNSVAFRFHRAGRWEQATWREFAVLAAGAASTCAAQTPGGGPVLLAVDNSVESLAVLAGLAVAGIGCAVFEADSPLLKDEASVLHALGATTVIGVSDAPAPYRALPVSELTRPVPGSQSLGNLADAATAARRAGADGGAGPAVLQSTSGSAGEPRLARQTVANLLRGGLIYASRYRVTELDTMLATVPMAHSFGLVGGFMCALVSGATLTTFDRYSPGGVREAIEANATLALGTPLAYELIIKSASASSSALRAALSSGGPLDPQVADAARRRFGCPVYQVYGSTEAGIIASQFARDEPWPAGSVGVAAPGVELRLGDPLSGAAAEPGAELWVRTSTMFGGYLGGARPGTARTPRCSGGPGDGGWYRTGDVAVIDPAGHLELTRRKDTFINVGGRKVNPSRVERVIASHASVTEAAVYGVRAAGGDEVWAAVAVSGRCTAEDLLAHCRSQLAPYEVPYLLHVMDRLPRSGMGKVDRGRLPRQA